EAGDLAGVLGRLALGVVEIGGNGDDGLLDLLAEIALRRFLHLLQDEGRNLGRGIFLAGRLDPGVAIVGLDDVIGDELLVLVGHRIVEATADQTLYSEDGAFGVGDGLALGGLA